MKLCRPDLVLAATYRDVTLAKVCNLVLFLQAGALRQKQFVTGCVCSLPPIETCGGHEVTGCSSGKPEVKELPADSFGCCDERQRETVA